MKEGQTNYVREAATVSTSKSPTSMSGLKGMSKVTVKGGVDGSLGSRASIKVMLTWANAKADNASIKAESSLWGFMASSSWLMTNHGAQRRFALPNAGQDGKADAHQAGGRGRRLQDGGAVRRGAKGGRRRGRCRRGRWLLLK